MDETARSSFIYCDNMSDLLQMTRVGQLYPPSPAKTWYLADSTFSSQQVLEVLELYSISSLPVRDAYTHKCAGFIDVLDILAYLVSKCPQAETIGLTDIEKAFDQILSQPISNLCDFSKRNPFIPVPVNQTLYHLLVNMKKLHCTMVHRVPIVSLDADNPQILSLLSQSDIISYIARHISVLGQRGQLPIKEHFGYLAEVVSVPPHLKAIDAFVLMHKRGLSGVPVIDSQNRLVANLSATDLEYLYRKQFIRLFMPVVDYIKACHADKQKIMTPPLSVTLETTLETLILKFSGSRVHRLYVVDSSGVLCGVITLTDLLQLLAAE